MDRQMGWQNKRQTRGRTDGPTGRWTNIGMDRHMDRHMKTHSGRCGLAKIYILTSLLLWWFDIMKICLVLSDLFGYCLHVAPKGNGDCLYSDFDLFLSHKHTYKPSNILAKMQIFPSNNVLDGQTDGWTDRQTEGRMDKQTEGQTNRGMEGRTDGRRDRGWTDRWQTDVIIRKMHFCNRCTDRQMDWWQTDVRTNRQTNRQKKINYRTACHSYKKLPTKYNSCIYHFCLIEKQLLQTCSIQTFTEHQFKSFIL